MIVDALASGQARFGVKIDSPDQMVFTSSFRLFQGHFTWNPMRAQVTTLQNDDPNHTTGPNPAGRSRRQTNTAAPSRALLRRIVRWVVYCP